MDKELSKIEFIPSKLEDYKSVGNYTIFKPPISNGSLSTYYIAMKKNSEAKLAIQQIPNSSLKKFVKYFERKKDNETFLAGNENIMISIDSLQSTSSYYLIYPLSNCTSADFFMKSKTLSEEIIRCILQGISKAIQIMHSKNIVHRDVSLSHILISQYDNKVEAKLGGLLCSICLDKHGPCNEYVGCVDYMAPEVKKAHLKKKEYGKSCDIWSLGICVLKMILGQNASIESWNRYLQTDKGTSTELIDIVNRCLIVDSSKRITITEFVSHPFFTKEKLTNFVVKPNLEEVHSISNFQIPKRPNIFPYVLESNILLGEGGFSKVVMCYKNDNPRQKYAMKIVLTDKIFDPRVLDQLKREIELMVQLRGSRFAIQIYDYFSSNSRLYLILEYCNGGNLEKYVKDIKMMNKYMSVEEIKTIWSNAVKAINYMHQKNMLHRDIKPQNVLLVKDKKGLIVDAKLCDFGLSRQTELQCKSILGTPGYIAPEIMQLSKGINVPYTNKIDIWSLGAMLYFMTYGIDVFQYPLNTQDKVYKHGIVDFPNNSSIYLQINEMIKKCMNIKPDKRPSAFDIIQDKLFEQPAFRTLNSLPMELHSLNIKNQYFERLSDPKMKYNVLKVRKTLISSDKKLNDLILLNQKLMSKIKGCPHLIKIYDFFFFHEDLYIIYENFTNMSMGKYLESKYQFTLQEIQAICKSLIQCLDFIHSKNIIQGYINPDNIYLVLDPNSNKISGAFVGDFGVTAKSDKNYSENVKKNKEKLKECLKSPELKDGKIFRNENDIYSFGVILSTLMNNRQIVEQKENSNPNLNQNLNNDDIEMKTIKEIANIVTVCNQKQNERPSAKELLALPLFSDKPIEVK